MTLYRYDDRGWYIGELPEGVSDISRTTELVPPIDSVSEEAGIDRAIYFNDQWNVLPYVLRPVESDGPITLGTAKARKIQELTETLHSKSVLPITVSGLTYPADKSMRDIMIGLIALESIPVGTFLFDINNMPHPVDSLEQVRAVAQAIAQRDADLYNQLLILSMQVGACDTISEVEAVVWP